MSSSGEELLQKAVQLHQSGEFKEGKKTAEKARKQFQKKKNYARATEALRVMADCTLNARDMKEAKKLYSELMKEAQEMANLWFQAAAHWGKGQIALHNMDYSTAIETFESGLEKAQNIADKWYTGWNAMGLGIAYRGVGRLADAKKVLQESVKSFRAANQTTFVTWAERILTEIGGEVPEPETKMWLCPMCGSKFRADQAEILKRGKMVTCEYCGTSVG
ncbi:MAG: hypothetical protein BAJATHORv1_70050 [Candidatus Thorarchaeota archaeon]|nr:MAG: hypothetical protein BAJATHORv1_70050 [Candidatus Thorarchaeota archaeon]